jgi:chitin disaccharide deacetylase
MPKVIRETLPPGLIINADDLGIHPSINAGILSAYRNGILTSCTMLVTTDFLEETFRKYVCPAALPIGIHLSLTLGKAAARACEVPDLIDEQGNLRLSARSLLLTSFTGASGEKLLGQIQRELEAQLARAYDGGLRATHADSHQHVHMNPAIFQLVEKLLPRFGIDRLRLSREPFPWFALGRDMPVLIHRLNIAKWAVLRLRATSVTPRLLTNDEFFGVVYSGAVTKHAFRHLIAEAPSTKAIEICVHPGFPAPEATQAYPRPEYNRFISAPARQIEHDLLLDEQVAMLARHRGLVLRGYDGTLKGR